MAQQTNDLDYVGDIARRLARSMGRVLSGQSGPIEAAITTLFAGGHLLIEDVPGVGKTTLAAALAKSLDAGMRRVQFTSDMLPTDVTGLSIYDPGDQRFHFHPGPVFTNVVIADEINRATPKTQSALLEAMGEGSVTVDGQTYRLPAPFTVAATQNPQDMEGTFALPEAQRDRFMTRVSLGYPDVRSEIAMLADRGGRDPLEGVTAVATVDDVVAAQHAVARVALSDEAARYLVQIVGGTRSHSGLVLGGSPRASLHLAKMARARAAIRGRAFVAPDDIAVLAGSVLTHRLTVAGRFGSVSEAHNAASAIVAEVVAGTPTR